MNRAREIDSKRKGNWDCLMLERKHHVNRRLLMTLKLFDNC